MQGVTGGVSPWRFKKFDAEREETKRNQDIQKQQIMQDVDRAIKSPKQYTTEDKIKARGNLDRLLNE